MQGNRQRSKGTQGKRQKAKVKRQKEGTNAHFLVFTFAFCLLPLAFCLSVAASEKGPI